MFMIDMQGTRAGGAVLRLLHGKRHEVVILRIDRGRAVGGNLPGQLPGMHFGQAFAALDRHAHAHAAAVDGAGFRRQADELHVVAAKRELGAEQGAIGSAQNQDVERFHNVKSKSVA
jgi:hypothetical protein